MLPVVSASLVKIGPITYKQMVKKLANCWWAKFAGEYSHADTLENAAWQHVCSLLPANEKAAGGPSVCIWFVVNIQILTEVDL